MDAQNLKTYFQKPELGLFLIRAGIGVVIALYGLNKFREGEETLRFIGSAISNIGIPVSGDSVFALLFGILAAGGELIGGILVAIGLLFRPAAAVLLFIMVVALAMHLNAGDAFASYAQALTFGAVFAGLLFTGPGTVSIQKA